MIMLFIDMQANCPSKSDKTESNLWARALKMSETLSENREC